MMWTPSAQSLSFDIKRLSFDHEPDPVGELAQRVVRMITEFNGSEEERAVHNERLASCVLGLKEAQDYVKAMIRDCLSRLGVESDRLDELTKEIYDRHYGLGPIEDLAQDPTISEIWVNGAEHVWIERNGRKYRVPRQFPNDDEVLRVIRRILQFDHQEVTRQKPIAESRMADGSRVTVIIPDVAKRPYINIRKFQSFYPTEENLLKVGTITQDMVDFLRVAVKGRSNILIIGETGSGKTSFLQYLVSLMDPNLRLGTIETKFELKLDEQFPDRNIFCYETKDEFGISMENLFKVVLRSSPDIIIVGEARGQEASDMINAMRRGHRGSVGTAHTNSPETAIDDLADMINQDGKRRDPLQLRHRIATAIDLIIQIHRFEDTGDRRVVRISEIVADRDSLDYTISDIFRYEVPEDGSGYFCRVGEVSEELKKKWVMFGVTQRDLAAIRGVMGK